MMNEVINMISVVDTCYVAILAISVSIVVDTLVYYREGESE